MPVQTPPAPPSAPESGALIPQAIPDLEIEDGGIEAGVIDDARARQRRHRRIGSLLLAVAAGIGALIAGMAGGGGGAGAGNLSGGQPAGSGPGMGSSAPGSSTSRAFAGAPLTQRHSNGVETYACRLAPPNRYLPARSGCVTVARADVNGDGRPDLIILYSRLGQPRPSGHEHGAPPALRGELEAKAAFLKVVLAGAGTVSTRVSDASAQANPVRAASIGAIAHVNDDPGSELFLRVRQISSGAAAVAYGFHDGRLIPAGVTLSYGGDSAAQAGFNCLPGKPQRLVQRTFELLGPGIHGWWKESEVVYAWHGPKLVEVARHTFKRHGALPATDVGIGGGCAVGTGAGSSGVAGIS